ncbi:MAG: hypothetical protein CMJ83_17070 [Planctomycetes bacterium]|nr:hypothetical protein [Planctomycetota bacterium]
MVRSPATGRRWLSRILLTGVAVGLCACTTSPVDAPNERAPRYTWDRVPGKSVALLDGERVLWRFHHDPEKAHAFFHPLALPGIESLTRDRPADHVWHHGLWFSWKYINKVNYWENARAADRPTGRTSWTLESVDTGDDGSATIRMTLSYAPQAGASPVLTEVRVLDVSTPGPDGGYRIDWTSRFTAVAHVVLDRTPLPGEPGGRVFGGYAGLSLRLVNLDERAAATTEGPVVFNADNRFRTRSAGLDYNGLVAGVPAGIAILDHPESHHSPTPWYVIRSKAMSFFSPAVICLGKEELQPGAGLTVRYRVIVHPGRWTTDRLLGESRRFVEKPLPRLGPERTR